MDLQEAARLTERSVSHSVGSERGGGAERHLHDQRRRVQMIAVSATNYLVGTALLSLYAWIGTVGWEVPIGYAGITTLGSLAFLCAVRTGLNMRARDPNLFVWQMAFAAVMLFGLLAAVPQLSFVFLCNVFVTAMFGVVQFTKRQFQISVVLVSLATAIVFGLTWDRLALPASTQQEVALLWLYLVSSLARFLVIATQVGALRGKLKEKNDLLLQSLKRIQELADHDELTGALARRRFMQMAETERIRCERSKADFCVALLDLDHFKLVNDQHGHMVGDQVLRRFCELVQGALRAYDQLGRYGGEEFVLLLPTFPPAEAPALTGRLSRVLASEDWSKFAPGLNITASIGVAVFEAGDTVQSLLNRADEALYKAKNAGRNRAEFAFSLSHAG